MLRKYSYRNKTYRRHLHRRDFAIQNRRHALVNLLPQLLFKPCGHMLGQVLARVVCVLNLRWRRKLDALHPIAKFVVHGLGQDHLREKLHILLRLLEDFFGILLVVSL